MVGGEQHRADEAAIAVEGRYQGEGIAAQIDTPLPASGVYQATDASGGRIDKAGKAAAAKVALPEQGSEAQGEGGEPERKQVVDPATAPQVPAQQLPAIGFAGVFQELFGYSGVSFKPGSYSFSWPPHIDAATTTPLAEALAIHGLSCWFATVVLRLCVKCGVAPLLWCGSGPDSVGVLASAGVDTDYIALIDKEGDWEFITTLNCGRLGNLASGGVASGTDLT